MTLLPRFHLNNGGFMFCASIPFQTMQNLPYDQLKDLSQNHENFSNSKPELQSRLCELLSNSQKNEPICLGPLLGPLMDRTVSEIVHAIACEAIKKGEELDQKTVLSVARRFRNGGGHIPLVCRSHR